MHVSSSCPATKSRNLKHPPGRQFGNGQFPRESSLHVLPSCITGNTSHHCKTHRHVLGHIDRHPAARYTFSRGSFQSVFSVIIVSLHPTFQEPDIQIDDTLASWKHGQLANTEALFTAATHTSQSYTLASRGLVRGMSAMAKGITSIQLSGVQARRSRKHGHRNCGRTSP